MSVVHSPLRVQSVPKMDIFSTFLPTFRDHGHKLALEDTTTGESYTFSSTLTLVERVARRLLQDGFRPRDRAAFCAADCVDIPVFAAAVWRLGGVVVGVNHILTTDDVTKQLEMVRAKFVFTAYDNASNVLGAVSHIDDMKVYVRGDLPSSKSTRDVVSIETIYNTQPDHYPALPSLDELHLDPDRECCAILFSSGTTGFPKAVMLAHSSLVHNVYALNHPEIRMNYPSQVVYQPMCHVFGLNLICACFMFGVTTYVMPKFDLEGYLRNIDKHKVPVMHVVPPVAVWLGKNPAVASYDLTHLERITSGAGPVAHSTQTRCLKSIRGRNTRFSQVYGMTETGGIVTLPPGDDHPLLPIPDSSVGVLAPSLTAKIIDVRSGAVLGPNQAGELCVRGPHCMLGYYEREDATRDTIDDQGWLHTGDIAKYDQDGYFYITDRIKDLIKYKGYQVAPAELEGVLNSSPAVAESAVFPVPHPEAGEMPRAWVVKATGAEVTERQIVDYVNGRVAPYKKLRAGVKFVDSLPRSGSGKILRRVIREQDRMAGSEQGAQGVVSKL